MNAERCFAYAKACGITARSFVESRLSALVAVNTPEEFNALIFPGEGSAGSVQMEDLERKIIDKSVAEILSIVNSFNKPSMFLVRLIKSYEYADLKNILAAIKKREKLPPHINLGRFSSINYDAYPNLHLMLKGTEYEALQGTLLEHNTGEDDVVQTLLDKDYYIKLLAELRRLPQNDITAFRTIIAEEISLMNCSWALRLRVYYKMSAEAVKEHLIDEKLDKNGKSLARDAIASLNFAVDHGAEWENWRRARFLNHEELRTVRGCNPRYFQNAAVIYLYHLARKNLRRRPFTLDTAACFIRLKQFEEQVLHGIIEGIKLNVPPSEVLAIMGAPV